MTVKTTGAEFKSFYSDPFYWPEDAYHEDAEIMVDGVEDDGGDLSLIADISQVTITGGAVLNVTCQGDSPSLEVYFKRWRKEQNTDTFIVTCDKEKTEAIKSAIASNGGKVKK